MITSDTGAAEIVKLDSPVVVGSPLSKVAADEGENDWQGALSVPNGRVLGIVDCSLATSKRMLGSQRCKAVVNTTLCHLAKSSLQEMKRLKTDTYFIVSQSMVNHSLI